MNSDDTMKGACEPYCEAARLATSVTPEKVYDLEARIDAFTILDPGDIETANAIMYSPKITAKQKRQLAFFMEKDRTAGAS